MLGTYDFCGHYDWTFEWLRQNDEEELVRDYWEEAIGGDSQLHARELIMAGGLEGMKRYWGHTLDEEGAKCVITTTQELFRVDMHQCPSKGFLIRNGLQSYHDYCDHCMGWIAPVLNEAGFVVLHAHNHQGQCWWEMRPQNDPIPADTPGRVAGSEDIRFAPGWRRGDLDTFAVPARNNNSMNLTAQFTTALVTPLNSDDSLHRESLALLMEQQISAGMDGVLLGGSMGAMQLLSDETYRDLMTQGLQLGQGKCRLLAGAGDTSLARTLQRISFLNGLQIDGVVVLAPYLMTFGQDELLDYFRELADFSRAPLFLYDLPGMTRCKIELETAQKLSEHPNIAGIKCSDEPSYARQLRDTTSDAFHIILAAPKLIDVFLRAGMDEHLDGIYCLCARQIKAIGTCAAKGDWAAAARAQQTVNDLLSLIIPSGVWRPATALLNHLGIPGHFKPRPHKDWDAAQTRDFLESDATRAMLAQLQG